MQTYFILDLFCLIARARAFLWIINPSQIGTGTQLSQYKNDDAADIIESDASDCRRFVTSTWSNNQVLAWLSGLVWIFKYCAANNFLMKKHSIYLLDLTP